eukprot:3363849-Amphidinium_carterae.1
MSLKFKQKSINNVTFGKNKTEMPGRAGCVLQASSGILRSFYQKPTAKGPKACSRGHRSIPFSAVVPRIQLFQCWSFF